MESRSDFDRRHANISELQWAHETLIRLIKIVQLNGLLTDELRECVVSMTKCAVLLEGIIMAAIADMRRRRSEHGKF